MARRVIEFTATHGRDAAKLFRIREMAAADAERWAMRALNAIAKSAGEVPLGLLSSGPQGLAFLGASAFAKAKWDDVEPLIVEMFKCITIVPDPLDPEKERRLLDDDIEEVLTRLQLRQEVLELHLGFFKAAVNWILTAASSSLKQPQAPETSPNT